MAGPGGDLDDELIEVRVVWSVRMGREEGIDVTGLTTVSATGWLQVACIAAALRHLSQAAAGATRMRQAA